MEAKTQFVLKMVQTNEEIGPMSHQSSNFKLQSSY